MCNPFAPDTERPLSSNLSSAEFDYVHYELKRLK